jgi:hypothetical protein
MFVKFDGAQAISDGKRGEKGDAGSAHRREVFVEMEVTDYFSERACLV